ncbi:MAG: carboxypeptidase-like regulatory domain-containing protein [Bacteroidota bacterium]
MSIPLLKLKKDSRLYLLLFIFIFFCSSAWSQTHQTVSGIVTQRDDNTTIPGITVSVKGSTTAISTDVNGKYSIRASNGTVLIFSGVGYTQKEVAVVSAREN